MRVEREKNISRLHPRLCRRGAGINLGDDRIRVEEGVAALVHHRLIGDSDSEISGGLLDGDGAATAAGAGSAGQVVRGLEKGGIVRTAVAQHVWLRFCQALRGAAADFRVRAHPRVAMGEADRLRRVAHRRIRVWLTLGLGHHCGERGGRGLDRQERAGDQCERQQRGDSIAAHS